MKTLAERHRQLRLEARYVRAYYAFQHHMTRDGALALVDIALDLLEVSGSWTLLIQSGFQLARKFLESDPIHTDYRRTKGQRKGADRPARPVHNREALLEWIAAVLSDRRRHRRTLHYLEQFVHAPAVNRRLRLRAASNVRRVNSDSHPDDDLEYFVTFSDAHHSVAGDREGQTGGRFLDRRSLYNTWYRAVGPRAFLLLEQQDADTRWYPIAASIVLPISDQKPRGRPHNRSGYAVSPLERFVSARGSTLSLGPGDFATSHSSHLLYDSFLSSYMFREELSGENGNPVWPTLALAHLSLWAPRRALSDLKIYLETRDGLKKLLAGCLTNWSETTGTETRPEPLLVIELPKLLDNERYRDTFQSLIRRVQEIRGSQIVGL